MNGPNEHALDTRLLRFRSRPGSEAALPLALDLIAASRWSDAVDVATSALAQKPGDVDLQIAEGRAYMGLGDLIRAQGALLEAAKPGTRKEPFRWLGEVLLKRGDAARAVKVLERARALDGKDAEIAALLKEAEALVKRDAPRPDATTIDLPKEATKSAPPTGKSIPSPSPSSAGSLRSPSSPGITRAPSTKPSEGAPLHPPLASVSLNEATVVRSELTSELAQASAKAGAESAAPEAPVLVSPMPPLATLGTPAGAMATSASAAVAPFPSAPLLGSEKPRNSPPPPPPKKVEPAKVEAPKVEPVKAAPAKVEAPKVESKQPPAPPKTAPKPPPAKPVAGATPPPPRASNPGPAPSASSPPGKSKSAPPRSVFGSSPGEVAAVPSSLADAAASAFASDVRVADSKAAKRKDADNEGPGISEVMASTSPGGFEAPVGEGSAKQAPRPFVPPREDESIEVEVEAPKGNKSLETKEAVPSLPSAPRATRAAAKTETPEDDAPLQAAPAAAPKKRSSARAWMLGLALTGGLGAAAYFGGTAYFASRHGEADALLASARTSARQGDYAALVRAETELQRAHALHGGEEEIQALLLFVESERALEDGTRNVDALRTTLSGLGGSGAHGGFVAAAQAVVALYEGDAARARTSIADALNAAPNDAFILYLAGRVGQRLGLEDAAARLASATEHDPALSSAAIALAEARVDEGQGDEARLLLQRVVERDATSLRAKLWLLVLQADGDVEAGLSSLVTLRAEVDHAAPADVLLSRIAEAQFESRAGRIEQAMAAIEAGAGAGVHEPALLVRFAQAAQRVGSLGAAEQAALEALTLAPTSVPARLLLAGIYIDRRNGQRALDTLAQLPASEDAEVLVLTARASMLLGNPAAVGAAAGALERFVTDHPNASAEVRAFQLRLALRSEVADGEAAVEVIAPLLESARRLAEDHPSEREVQFTLGEIAIWARESETAEAALQRVVDASPLDAEGYYLLGRARRIAGNYREARTNLTRAVELRPEHLEAQAALAGVLLDMGAYEEADHAFEALASSEGSVDGVPIPLLSKLGRVESLLGLGRIEEANTQLESVAEADRTRRAYVLTATRVAMVTGHASEAIELIGPIANAMDASPLIVSLYGDALLLAGEIETALAAYDQALGEDESLPEALIGRAELYVRGRAAEDAGALLDRAADALERRARPASLRARMLMLRGRVSLLSERLPEARESLRQATELAGCPVEAWFWLGEALAGANSPESRAAYVHYLDAPSTDEDLAARARRAIDAEE